MPTRTYGQYCTLAKALDVLGERWTLLIVRELLAGPRRYTDLLEALDGIGTNLLARRLKDLRALDLVSRHRLPPPAPATVYELTPAGRELRPVVHALARWGARFLGPPDTDDRGHGHWLALGLRASANHAAARGVSATYEFRTDGVVFHVVVDDGTVGFHDGPATERDVLFEGDPKQFLGVIAGHAPDADDVTAGRIRIKGDPAAVARAARIFAPVTG